MCYYRWFVQAYSPVCSTLRIAQKCFCDVVRLGCLGGGGACFRRLGVCIGFQRGRGSGFEFRALTAWEKCCWVVLAERALFLRVGAGKDCGRDGWGPSQLLVNLLEHHARKCPGRRGEGHQWSLQLCSLSAGGSCGLLHYSSHTRQWCSWSARSQCFPFRKWWGWVEGDLHFSAGGESVGAVAPSWRVM